MMAESIVCLWFLVMVDGRKWGGGRRGEVMVNMRWNQMVSLRFELRFMRSVDFGHFYTILFGAILTLTTDMFVYTRNLAVVLCFVRVR